MRVTNLVRVGLSSLSIAVGISLMGVTMLELPGARAGLDDTVPMMQPIPTRIGPQPTATEPPLFTPTATSAPTETLTATLEPTQPVTETATSTVAPDTDTPTATQPPPDTPTPFPTNTRPPPPPVIPTSTPVPPSPTAVVIASPTEAATIAPPVSTEVTATSKPSQPQILGVQQAAQPTSTAVSPGALPRAGGHSGEDPLTLFLAGTALVLIGLFGLTPNMRPQRQRPVWLP